MTIEQRLHRLERQNRWMKRAGALAIAAVATALLVGQGKPKTLPNLEVKSLVVKDEQGRVRASIVPFEQGAALMLRDAVSDGRLGLGAWGGPFLMFADGKDNVLTLALKKDDGTLEMEIHDKLTIKLAGRRGALVVEDKNGKTVFVAPEK